MSRNKHIQLVLITGFLGSGKTSVINNLLKHMANLRVGLILNDFGSIVVDSALIKDSGNIVTTKSLSGGQIFCSCLSGSFIDSVEALVKVYPDLIVVEASGLAKPSPLLEIVSIIQKRTNYSIVYNGMLCVIDAERYLLLSQSFKTLEEQIIFSDWFVINKCDLVDTNTIAQVVSNVESLRPLAPIFTTKFGTVSSKLYSLLINYGERELLTDTLLSDSVKNSYIGWGVHGRPKTCVFKIYSDFNLDMFKQFLADVSISFLRMKGFLPLNEDMLLLVDAVGPHVILSKRAIIDSIEVGLVCIYAADFDAVNFLLAKWKIFAGTEAICEEIA